MNKTNEYKCAKGKCETVETAEGRLLRGGC
jgi:hypothetical protein